MLATPVPVPVEAAAAVVTRIAVVAPSRVKAGRALSAFCAYVYVERPSRKIGVFTSTLSVKAPASKRVRAS